MKPEKSPGLDGLTLDLWKLPDARYRESSVYRPLRVRLEEWG